MSEYPAPVVPVKKKRKVFLWVFLAVQALFIVWIIAGASAASKPKDCGSLTAQTCQDAANIGTGLGVILIIGLWVAADVILGIGYLIYKVATKK